MSATSSSSLHPPFRSGQASHLPTPRSPNTTSPYIENAMDSPTVKRPRRQELNESAQSLAKFDASHSFKVSQEQTFMTPESSPLIARIHSATNHLRVTADSCATLRKSNSTVKSESPIGDLHASSPRDDFQNNAPHSCLSSPFTERLSLDARTPSKSSSPRRDLSSPTLPLLLNDVFSQTPPLAAPFPQRIRDEETEQIRLLLADNELARMQETEFRRPDYLTRAPRTPSDFVSAEKVPHNKLEPITSSGVVGGLGIATSPLKGRRLKLFQETSEESFEESLMVNGYGYSGSTSRPSDQLSQHTLEWLSQRSPGVVIPSSRLNPLQEASTQEPLTEKEIRKRKRIAAFRSSSTRPRSPKLFPVDVEGKGRILLSQDEYEYFDGSELEAIGSKRGGSRRKKKGTFSVKGFPSKRKGQTDDFAHQSSILTGPNWLDSEFPWCMKANERAAWMKEDEDHRMMWIERFLDQDTDEAESEEEVAPPVGWKSALEHRPLSTYKRGRGKTVPIKVEPVRTLGTMYFPSDPADARAALLSRRAVREMAIHRALALDEDSDGASNAEEVCICRGKNNSRSQVQCDDCERWYHLRCMGIRNVEDLGDDDEPWYCPNCQQQERSPTPEPEIPSSEPIIVPTEDDDSTSPSKDPLFFEATLEESPLSNWTKAPPTTPLRGRNLTDQFTSSSPPSSPSKEGPFTPRVSSAAAALRVFATPGMIVDSEGIESHFDPTSTPSRGIKFGAAFVTPKNRSAWSANRAGTGGLFQTPLRNNAPIVSSSGRQWLDDSGSVNFSSPSFRSVNHDSPIRRKDGGGRMLGPSRRLFESPMMFGGTFDARNSVEGGLTYQPGMLDDSPVVRSVGRKRMREEADVGD